jgi:hypothetical protein
VAQRQVGQSHPAGDEVSGKVWSGLDLAKALDAEGFPLPKNCTGARLIMTIDSVNVIQYDVFLEPEEMVKFGKALQRLGEADK